MVWVTVWGNKLVRKGCFMFGRLGRRSSALGGAVAVGALWVLTTAAGAAEPQPGSPQAGVTPSSAMSICSQDLAKLCPGIEAGGGKKLSCLMSNTPQLSADCDAAVKIRVHARGEPGLQGGVPAGVQLAQAATPPAAATAPPAAIVKPGKAGRLNKKACKAELASLCATVTSSRTKCLMANQPKLGPECAAAVAAVAQTREVAKAACVMDAAKLCGSARGAARTQCLEANKAQLSPACLTRIERKEAKQTAAPKQ